MRNRVFIGYDQREPGAFRVCVRSMNANVVGLPPLVLPISRGLLGTLYERPTTRHNGVLYDELSQQPMSTDFSIARFFSALIGPRDGWILFCDCDFMWRGDVNELFTMVDNDYAVMVVKHQQLDGIGEKMDGQPQTYYRRKNWSSLMLINCSAPEWQSLTKERLNLWTKQALHAFSWIDDKRIGSLPVTWNWLASVCDPIPGPGPKVVHYTLGTPEMKGYEDAPFASEWRAYHARG